MLRRNVPLLALVVIAPAALAQEASYNDDRIAPSRVPAAFLKTAEKETPGVRLSAAYKDNEKEYRFVGKAADGKTFSVKLDRDGKLLWRRTYTDLLPARLPKPVASALRDELAGNKDLAGFQAARTSLVERFDYVKGESATYHEVFGHTPAGLHPRLEIDASGKLLRVDTSFIPSTDDYTRRVALAGKDVPPEVQQGILAVAPGTKIARVFRITTKDSPTSTYEALGRGESGRGVEVWLQPDGHAFVMGAGVPLGKVPRAALEAVERQSRTDKQLEGFRPREAWQLRLIALGEDRWQFYGDSPDGEPLDVRVDPKGEVLVTADSREALREEAGISRPEPQAKDAVPARGFAVLAARYGIDHHWLDVTDLVRAAAAEGRTQYTIEKIPDPAYGRHKTTVLLYAMDGKVGLSVARDDEPLPLESRQDVSKLAAIPGRGFAVLAARFGIYEKWEDVTDAVRARVVDGRLDVKPVEAKLPDPMPGEPYALAVAYASGGKVGLYVQSQWRSTSLPPDGPPVNSEALLARSIEFPQAASVVAFTPDGRQVVVGVEDGSIRMIDATSGREARRFDGHGPGRVAVAVAAGGGLIASGGGDKAVRLWDVKTGREKAVLRGHSERVHRVALSPNGRQVASIARDKTVRLWNASTGGEVRKFEGHTDFIDGVKFTPDGRQLVTASWDGTVRIWDLATGREVRKFPGNGVKIGDVALSRSGRDLFFGAEDGTMRRWEPDSGRDPVSFPTYAECGWGIAPMPDGHRILISDRIAAALWDCKTTHPVLRLERHTGRVTGLAIAPNGRRAATCGDDKTLKIWDLPDLGR